MLNAKKFTNSLLDICYSCSKLKSYKLIGKYLRLTRKNITNPLLSLNSIWGNSTEKVFRICRRYYRCIPLLLLVLVRI